MRFVKLEKVLVSVPQIASHKALQFVEFDGTQVKRLPIGFLKGLGAVHATLEIDTVRNGEHVQNFMNHHFARSQETQILFLLCWFSLHFRTKLFIMSSKTENLHFQRNISNQKKNMKSKFRNGKKERDRERESHQRTPDFES
jgi:hypothetical protein